MLKLRTTFLTLALLSIALAPTASAHSTQVSPDGNVKITWGLLNEPAVTWTKTGLDLIVRDNATNTGIMGVHETLKATLIYGDEELAADIQPQHGQEVNGRYTFVHPITLTRAGLYSLRVEGTVNGTAIDMTIPAAHEYGAIETTFFPEAPNPFTGAGADTAGLQAEIDALKARLAALETQANTQAQTPADVTPQGENQTPALGLLGALAAVGVVLALRARRS